MRFEVKTVSFENIERCCSPWINQIAIFILQMRKYIADGLKVLVQSLGSILIEHLHNSLADMWNPTCNLHYSNTTFKVVQFRKHPTNNFSNVAVGYPTSYFEDCSCRVPYNLLLKMLLQGTLQPTVGQGHLKTYLKPTFFKKLFLSIFRYQKGFCGYSRPNSVRIRYHLTVGYMIVQSEQCRQGCLYFATYVIHLIASNNFEEEICILGGQF